MKCHKHYDMDAVGQCIDCSKGLCPECASKYTIPICDNCNLLRLKNDKNILVKNTVITVVAFIIGLFVYSYNNSPVLFTFIGALFFAGIPWGWSFLNKITPEIFLFMPIIGWVFFFCFKFSIALMIGIFILPIKVYQIFNRLKEINIIESYINS